MFQIGGQEHFNKPNFIALHFLTKYMTSIKFPIFPKNLKFLLITLKGVSAVLLVFHFISLIYFSDIMAENVNKELDVKDSDIISTVEETCFVNKPEDDIKLETTEVQGKLNNSTFCNLIVLHFKH